MASDINEHISSEERSKWNKTGTDLAAHIADKDSHVPDLSSSSGATSGSANYYLGSDLRWHRIPIGTITVS